VLALVAGLALVTQALAQTDAQPSWNDGPAKQEIVACVKETTEVCFSTDNGAWQNVCPDFLSC
jgi:hypothetical protein